MRPPPGTDEELLQVFLAECGEVLEESARTLAFLERRPRSVAALRSLFRNYHTLRGAAATVGLANVAAHLEQAESLLEGVLDGEIPLQPAHLIETLVGFNASVRSLIEPLGPGVESDGLRRNVSAAMRALRRQASAGATAVAPDAPDPKRPAVLPVAAADVDALFLRAAQVAAASASLEQSARGLGEAGSGLRADVRQLSRASMRLRRQVLRLRAAARESSGESPLAAPAGAEACVEDVVRLEAGHRGFAVPIAAVERAIALEPDVREQVRRERLFSFRGHRIPVLFLGPLAGAPSNQETAALVLRAGQRLMAIAADRLLWREEVVVHGLGHLLAAHPFVSGTALAADGDVLFRLEVDRLFTLAAHEVLLPPDTDAPVPPAAGAVLVVDDSRLILRLASRFLAADNIETETAEDGLEALEKLAASPVRAVVTDLEMPGLHGYDLLLTIKRDPRWSHLPVIVCTSCIGEGYRTRALELGAAGYIAKPFTREQLCSEVRRVTEEL